MVSRGTHTDPRQPGDGPPPTELLEDWITIWQSELTALILDREMQDTMLRLVDGWAMQSRGLLALSMAPRGHDAVGSAGADAAAGAATVDAASAGQGDLGPPGAKRDPAAPN